jgi:hypothetical protein
MQITYPEKVFDPSGFESLHSNKLRVESTRKRPKMTRLRVAHACVSIFKYILAKTQKFFLNTRSSVISTRTSVISARRVWFSHAWVWFSHARVWFSHARVWFSHAWVRLKQSRLWFPHAWVRFKHSRLWCKKKLTISNILFWGIIKCVSNRHAKFFFNHMQACKIDTHYRTRILPRSVQILTVFTINCSNSPVGRSAS